MTDFAGRIADLSPEKRELLLQQLNKQKEDTSRLQIRSQQRESGSYPLSFAQQRLWFLEQWEPSLPLYNLSLAVHLQGALHPARLEQSLCEIVNRHAALRTTFGHVNGQPVQIVTPSLLLPLLVADLRALPEFEQEAELQHLINQEAWHPFDLSRGPLLRARLLRLSEKKHAFLLTLHHIITDGWSMGVLFQELSILYNAGGKESAKLPPLPIQYPDFALWQREWLQGEVLEHQLHYWKQQLGSAPDRLELLPDHPRPLHRTFHGAQERFLLSKALSKALRLLSQQEGVTLFMTLLAALGTLLWRYSGQEDLLIGSPIANRTHSELEPLIGFFVNTLVLRIDLAGNPSFRALLGRVREMTLGAYAHQDLPFEKLVEELAPERNLGHSPLFQVLFVLQNTPRSGLGLELEGLEINSLSIPTETAQFDLALMMTESEQGLQGLWEYNTDLFEAETIQRLLQHLQILLEGIVAHPEQSLASLPLLSEAERLHILAACQSSIEEAEETVCLHELFEAHIAQTPDALALSTPEGQLSYAELNARSNQLAQYLHHLGLAPGQPVALWLSSADRQVIAMLAVLKAGGMFVFLGSEAPLLRIRLILEEIQAFCLLTEAALMSRYHNLLREHRLECAPTLLLLDPPEQVQREEHYPGKEHLSTFLRTNLGLQITTHSSAYLAYTSGSTGRPKGIVQSHRAFCQFLRWHSQQFAIGPSSRIAQWATTVFDASYQEILGALCFGATLYMTSPEIRYDPPKLLDWLRQQDITFLMFVPSFCQQMLQSLLARSESAPHPFPHLDVLLLAGEVLPLELAKNWLTRFPKQPTLFNLYGPTESVLATYYAIREVPSGQSKIPIGHAIGGRQILILDQVQQPCPLGVLGEIYIRSPYLTSGYFQRPQETAKVFLQNPLHEHFADPVYRTGDLGRWLADGTLEFYGRRDQQVKLRGMRVEPEEIEAIVNLHECVEVCAVIACQDPAGEMRLVAYIVARQQGQEDLADLLLQLRHFLSIRLPEPMLPSLFVTLPTLPRTVSGKVDRRSLPQPDWGQRLPWEPFVLPRTPLEESLAQIWMQVLHLKRIGVYDNFFHIGGHSLLATQIIARVRDTFQREDISLRTLFEAPTIATLAQIIAPGQNGLGYQQEVAAPKADTRSIDQLMTNLDQLSEEEVTSLLRSMLTEAQGTEENSCSD